MTTGDLNNDGYVDIITTADNGKLNVLLGAATNSFTNSYTIDVSSYIGASDIDRLELVDVDNDDKLDLIANLLIGNGYGDPIISTPLAPVLVLLNQGSGLFTNTTIQPVAAISAGFVTGDFNGDGKLDILVRSNTYSAEANNVYPLTLYVGSGMGNFTQQSLTIPGIDTISLFGSEIQMAAGDFNGDAKTELVFNLYDRLSIYKYDNGGAWSEIYQNSSDFLTQRTNLTVGDLNNDGKIDIITAGTNSIDLLIGQSNGSFNSQVSSRSTSGITELKIGNANGDLRSDLVIVDRNNLIESYSLNNSQQLIELGIPFKIQSSNTYLGIADKSQNPDTEGDKSYEKLLKFNEIG